MEKKAWYFRNIVANVVLIAVLSVTIVFVWRTPANNVPALEPVRGGNCANSVSIAITLTRGASGVDDILNVFAVHDIRATFFVSGVWGMENLSSLKAVHAAGHELGNHGFFNETHVSLNPSRIREEIELTHSFVKTHTDVDMAVFMPPFQGYSVASIEIARALGYTTVAPRVLANQAPEVGLGHTPESLAVSTLQNLKGGAFIVLDAGIVTATALPQIIDGIAAQDLSIVPIYSVLAND